MWSHFGSNQKVFVSLQHIIMKYYAIIDLQLGDADKPLKLFSKWPTLLKRFTKGNPLETPHIFLKRNVFLSSFKESSVSKL